jgi:acylpyruvate hydrolase
MRLATLRSAGKTVAVRLTDTHAVEVPGFAHLGALLRTEGWQVLAESADGAQHPLSDITPKSWAPVVPDPGKILCIGLNYRTHIREMGRELPEHPTVFSKYPEALVGAYDDIDLSEISDAVDWEGELAVIIGAPVRNVDHAGAAAAIAGYAVLNDVTMRDFQYRTTQWLQGKTFEDSTPFGPYLLTPDEFDRAAMSRVWVDGDLVQEAPVSDLVFSVEALISYMSKILTLQPGDVIATGTSGGVGHAMKPPRYLHDGSILETEIDGLGRQRNRATHPAA